MENEESEDSTIGLDMYLNKRIYPSADQLNRLTIDGINPKKITHIEEEFGYWRKANAIHKWFVDNVQDGNDDCKDYYVSSEQLGELLGLVERVLANHSLAKKLLPVQAGFFFGGSDYDEYYFECLEETKKIITTALKDKDADFYYDSSW